MAFKSIQKPKTNPYLFAIIILLFIFLMIIIPFQSTFKRNGDTTTTTYQPSAVIFSNDLETGNGDPLQSENSFYKAPANGAYGYGLPPPISVSSSNVKIVPVNVPTQSTGGNFSQIGVLQGENDEILPLMGRISQRNHNKWNLYSIQNSGSGNISNRLMVVSIDGKKPSNNSDFDEVSNNDNVYIQGYKQPFRASLYDNKTLEYIPMI